MSGVHLLNVSAHVTDRTLLFAEVGLRPLDNRPHDERAEWQGYEYDQSKHRADAQHHRGNTDEGDSCSNNLSEALLKRGRNDVDVVCDAAQNFTMRLGVEV